MYNRLIKFLNLHNILYSKQFGFRNNHSTTLALIDLINNVFSPMDRNETTLGIFLGLSKARNFVSKWYDIRDTALAWIKSYLRIGLNLFSLGAIDLIRGKLPVTPHRAPQFLDLFCLLFTLTIFSISLA